MRVAILIRRLNIKGGAQLQAIQLARELAKSGHTPKLYTFAYDKDRCFSDLLEGLSVVSLGERRGKLRWLPYFLKENILARELAFRIDPESDVLNPHGEGVYKTAYYFKKLRSNIPATWMMNDMPTKLASFERAASVDTALVLPAWKRILYALFDRWERSFIACMDEIVVLDNRDKEWVRSYFQREATIIRSGVDAASFEFTERKSVGKSLNLITTSIFFPHRRFEDTIRAVSLLRERGFDPHLSIIGEEKTDVRYAEKIRILVRDLKLQNRVHLLGSVDSQTLKQLYAKSDVFVFVSHMQSWGIAVFEAMSSGLPVVVSSSAGASEVLEDQKTALIVPPKDPKAIANALERLVTDASLYNSMSRQGRAFVIDSISWKRYAAAMYDLFLKKTILIPITNNFFARNFLETDAFEVLRRDKKTNVIFLFKKNRVDYINMFARYQKENANISFDDTLPDLKNNFLERVFKIGDASIIKTKTAYLQNRSEFFGAKKKTASVIAKFILRSVLRHFGTGVVRKAYRAIYYMLPSNSGMYAILKKYKPDIVFFPTLLLEEYNFLKAAKKKNIRTVGLVFSWDNFYSKSVLRVHPDRLLVHTRSIQEQAKKFGDYPEENITVIGIPQYDRHFLKKGVIPREEFIRSLGGDPNKKIILYGFSGKQGLEIDIEMLRILHSIIKDKSDVQVLIRPYPRFDFSPEKLERIKKQFGFLGENVVDKSGENWGFSQEALSLSTNSLCHADLVVTMYSTFFIEAAIFDKPIVGIAYDGTLKRDYWNSARRFFEWEHLAEIQPLRGIKLVSSNKQFKQAVETYLKHPEEDRKGRMRIVEQQCNFTDGKSGLRLGAFLVREFGT